MASASATFAVAAADVVVMSIGVVLCPLSLFFVVVVVLSIKLCLLAPSQNLVGVTVNGIMLFRFSCFTFVIVERGWRP